MPDQSKSDYCFLLSPLKETNCFTRSFSDLERENPENVNEKCCYIAFNNIEQCTVVDSTNIEEFKTSFIEAHLKYNYIIENLKVLCGDSNGNSADSKQDSSGNSGDSKQDSSGSFTKIFGISYYIWIIILFV